MLLCACWRVFGMYVVGRVSSVVYRPSVLHNGLHRSYLSDSFPSEILCIHEFVETGVIDCRDRGKLTDVFCHSPSLGFCKLGALSDALIADA